MKIARLATVALVLLPLPVFAEIALPPGFTAQTYVTGRGFDASAERGSRGIPAIGTIGFDHAGALYLAKPAFRFRGNPGEELGPIYRTPVGGATITPETEQRYLYGPPLWNPDVAGVSARGELFVSTHDRERKVGALYRIRDGQAVLFAGGTPPAGSPPLLNDPEAVVFDATGNVYVLDREQGVVVKLDPTGKVLDPQYLSGLGRGRALLFDGDGRLWIASDGPAGSPFQDGSGQVWQARPDGTLTPVLHGPLPAGMSAGPGGAVFVALRRTGKILLFTPDGGRTEFGSFGGSAIRALTFAPVTEETRKAGIAGDLFVVTSPAGNFAVSEVLRISGPFEEFVRRANQRESRR